jgi:hypothetical protein
MTTPEFIEDKNLSRAWARAVHPMTIRGGVGEIAPLCVSITGFDDGVPREDQAVRSTLDAALGAAGKQDCHTVANTIFPQSMWNPRAPRSALFDRYARSLPRMRKASKKNRHGMYFERLVQGGPDSHPNQLDFVIETYNARPAVRRSALQVAVYDAKRDQTAAAQRGFPCLQHVTFAPVGDGLSVNAFYATQYVFERAYGNYLGLCRLGQFVAHELGLTLARVTCFTGIMLRDGLPAGSKQEVVSAINASVKSGKGGA